MKTRPARQHIALIARAGLLVCAAVSGILVASCAPMKAPDARSINIPAPTPPEERRRAINEAAEGVIIVPLGKDVLVPAMDEGDPLPNRVIGPFELRSENLAGALQLILADYDIPLAFESDQGMTVGVTVSNLKGPLDKVVEKVCSLANMYCLYDEGVLTIKESQTFTVSLPPLPADTSYDAIVSGLKAFTGADGTVDTTTRTMIYTATERTAKQAVQYFDRLRKSTAMIVYETYIWEVGLNGGNSAGIRWSQLGETIGAYNLGFSVSGDTVGDLGTPISIGLPTKGALNMSTGDILEFISTQGAVKTISQPQLTVLSGSEATLRVAETEAYVESLTRTQNTTNDTETVSTTTGQVDTGFTLTIGSSWDNGTVYGNVDINLQQLLEFQDFPAGESTLRLPKTAERELQTQVRVRPGDSVLIAGLVRERQEYDKTGVGLSNPILPFSRSGLSSNTELVILLRPRVVVYKPIDEIEYDKVDRARTSLVHADVPTIAELSRPEGIPSDTFKKDVVAPNPYDPAKESVDAAETVEGGSLSATDVDPASDKVAEPVDVPAAAPVPASAQEPDAKSVPPEEEDTGGTLPTTLLDPSLEETP
ncbi:MAG: type II and III secretion system family protein [Proteobacteria bacterium]|nr:type II and III secretion system family protein [Pseudomonadota bacterium]